MKRGECDWASVDSVHYGLCAALLTGTLLFMSFIRFQVHWIWRMLPVGAKTGRAADIGP